MIIRIDYAPMNNAPTTAESANGTLTAEQVREAIFNSSTYATYDGTRFYANGKLRSEGNRRERKRQ